MTYSYIGPYKTKDKKLTRLRPYTCQVCEEGTANLSRVCTSCLNNFTPVRIQRVIQYRRNGNGKGKHHVQPR